MKSSYNNIITFSIIFFFTSFLNAQVFEGDLKINDDNQNHTLILKNGEQLDGKIISIENTQLRFLEENNSTVLVFELYEIEKVMVEKFYNYNPELDIETKETIPTPNQRLFFTDTGFGLERGQTEYYTNYGIVHMLDHGVSKNTTMGIGFSYPGYLILHTKINYATGRFIPKFRGGFDFLIAGKPERLFNQFENKEQWGWNGFSKLSTYFSYGDSKRMMHIGLSIMTVFEPFEDFNILAPFDSNAGIVSFNFGGTVRFAPKWNLIYENTFGALEGRNVFIFGLFSGIGVNWFDGKNSLKIALNHSSNFRFFNFPVDELNTLRKLPFVSYSRFF